MNEKILVIKLGALGDFIYALGAMKAIRTHHKDALITLLTQKPYVALAQQSGYFDEIIIDPKPKFNPLDWIKFRHQLNDKKFTRVYDLQNNDRTARYFKLFSPRPEWAGVVARATYRNTDPDRKKFHSFLSLQKILAAAGIPDAPLDPLDWMQADLSAFHVKKPYILMVPGSSPQRPNKRWPATHYRQLAERLIEAGIQPVLLGSDSERQTAREITGNLPVLDLTGETSLAQIAELARGAAAAIGNDTGPMHLVSLTGCPSIFFYRHDESNIRKHGPQAKPSFCFESDDLKNINVADVFSKTREMLRL